MYLFKASNILVGGSSNYVNVSSTLTIMLFSHFAAALTELLMPLCTVVHGMKNSKL